MRNERGESERGRGGVRVNVPSNCARRQPTVVLAVISGPGFASAGVFPSNSPVNTVHGVWIGGMAGRLVQSPPHADIWLSPPAAYKFHRSSGGDDGELAIAFSSRDSCGAGSAGASDLGHECMPRIPSRWTGCRPTRGARWCRWRDR